MADKRYKVELVMKITDTTDPANPSAFFDSALTYSDVPYDVMVDIEGILVSGANALQAKGKEYAGKGKR